jgi:hypothetical protein
MALPLLAAGAVEAARLDLSRWRRHIEATSLLVVAGCWLARVGWVMAVVLLIFALCSARLSLPRGKTQGRQALFMAFLLFLLTAVANTSISFLPLAILWTAAAAWAMLLHSWGEKTGNAAPPRSALRALTWTLAATLIACPVFLALPRSSPRWSPRFAASALGGAPRLPSVLSLGGSGTIRRSGAVIARIVPPEGLSAAGRREIEDRMPLLICYRMEEARQGRWERGGHVPRRHDVDLVNPHDPHDTGIDGALDYFAYPTPSGLIPLPQGMIRVAPPLGKRIELHGGGAALWGYPQTRPVPFALALGPVVGESIPSWEAERRGLSSADPATSAALDWSLRVAPPAEATRPSALADALADDLRSFGYTLDNPSGGAEDPLGDFLTRTKAGHCEYFAHALASALRHRGVASRVVAGYRLGAWIDGGGYWLITQNEAHSWVEYADPDRGEWVTIDPTPAAAESHSIRWSLYKRLGDAIDAARFSWDRHVVLFSDTERRDGLMWVRGQAFKLRNIDIKTLGVCAAVAILLFALWTKRGSIRNLLRPNSCQNSCSGAAKALRPLVAASGIQPLQGETMRSWLGRLGRDWPERDLSLAQLTDLVETCVYGDGQDSQGGLEEAARRAAAEAKAWKKRPRDAAAGRARCPG